MRADNREGEVLHGSTEKFKQQVAQAVKRTKFRDPALPGKSKVHCLWIIIETE